MLKNTDIVKRLGGEEGLAEILTAYKGKCSTCGDKGYKWLKNVDEYLADVTIFAEKFHDVKGFDDVVRAMRTGGNTTQDGLTHMLTQINKLDRGSIAEFEGKIVDALADTDALDKICLNCAFDVKLRDNTLIEFKSYTLESLSLISTTKGANFVKQFKQYLQTVKQLDQLQYVFNKEKISDINLIKKEFQKIFENNAENIFNTSPNLFIGKAWNGNTITSWESLKILCKDDTFYQSTIFNFVKLQ